MKLSSNNYVLGRWENNLHRNESNEIQNNLWPSSEDFFHPWNPVFGSVFRTTNQLKAYPALLLKDGALSLVDFFFRFPNPTVETPTIIVHADLAFLVPDSWQQQCFLYRLETHRTYTPTQKIVFYAHATESFLNWSIMKFEIDDFLLKFSKNAEVSAHICQRQEVFEQPISDQTIAYELTSTLQKNFTKKISFLNLHELKALMSKKDVTYINLDLYKSAVGLCSVESLMMSGRCQVFPRPTYKGSKEKEIARKAISFQHDLVLYNFQSKHQDFLNLFFDYKLSGSSIRLPFPVAPKIIHLLRERLESA